jgi:hypothetical protein
MIIPACLYESSFPSLLAMLETNNDVERGGFRGRCRLDPVRGDGVRVVTMHFLQASLPSIGRAIPAPACHAEQCRISCETNQSYREKQFGHTPPLTIPMPRDLSTLEKNFDRRRLWHGPGKRHGA